MAKKKSVDLSLELIEKRFSQLRIIFSKKPVEFPLLAKELGVKMTELMDFVQQTPRYHFDFKIITKAKNTVLAIES